MLDRNSDSLARALQRSRVMAAPSTAVKVTKSPSVTKRLLAELVALRKNAVATSTQLVAFQHDSKMARAVFKVRLDALISERDALMQAQMKLADQSTRLEIEVATLKVGWMMRFL